ncbi:MAG: glutamate--tRNA ligase [Thermoprotei archaeon]|nr:MAG: glutamate--tRNA ligase [Thermoprotei archaeon]
MSGGSQQFPHADEVRRLALKHALLNALRYGRAKEGPVISKVLGERPDLRPFARDVVAVVREVVAMVNSMSREEMRSKAEELGLAEERRTVERRRELPPLPNVDKWGYVKTRFAPNPDFLIHLGNARPALLSHIYARMYKGGFVLRFEDTDPRIKTPIPEAYQRIREDLRWLGISWDEEYVQSMRMELYYDVARKLIEKGGAYVDLCTAEEFRKFRSERRACPHRDRPIEEQLELWDKMIEGHFGEGEAVLRIKTDLAHPDPSVIDWVAFRVIDTDKHPHPVTGSRYVVWPTYNFAAAVDDHFMGITHILRGREHAVNTVKQSFIYMYMGWRYPEVVNLGRVNLEGFILSKSRIKELLTKYPGRFLGLDDPRFGTIASLRRRGILPDTIREVILELGVKSSDATVSWDNVAAVNRRIADSRSKRLMFVKEPLEVCIEGIELPFKVSIPYHPSADLGERSYVMTNGCVYVEKRDFENNKGQVVRLMSFINVRFEERSGRAVAKLVGYTVDEARRYGAPIIHWVPKEHSVRARLYVVEGLRLRRVVGMAESSVKELNSGEIIQLVRLGFARVERTKPVPLLIYAHP